MRAATAALAAAVVLATAVAGRWTLARHRADLAARSVALAVTYGEAVELARRLGVPPQDAFAALRRAGATAVLAKELTTGLLDGVAVLTPRDLQVLAAQGGPLVGLAAEAARRREWNAFLLGPPQRIAELEPILAAKGVPASRISLEGAGPAQQGAGAAEALAVPLTPAELDRIGLGFPVERLRELEQAGFDTFVQLRDREDEAAPLGPLLEPLRRLQRLRAVFFNDPALPGYPERLGELTAELQRLGAPVGVIEGFPQEGLPALVGALGGRAVRLHAIREEELQAYPPERAVERYRLAAAERTIRVLLVRVYPDRDPRLALARTEAVLQGLGRRLAQEGLTPGPPAVLPVPELRPAALLALTAGLGAALALAGSLAGLFAPGAVAGAALVGLGTALIASGRAYTWMKLAAMAVSLAFPVLGVLAVFRVRPRTPGAALAALLAATAVSAAGGLWQLALQAHPQFVLRTDVPPGTKLAAVLPPLLVAALAARGRPGRDDPARRRWTWDATRALREARRLLARPVPAAWLLLAPAVALLAAVYVSRTGNQPLLPPLPAERALRAWLDDVLGVRPRFKEFLVGHPALLLAACRGARSPWDALLWGLAAVGQVSVVNTFSHAHTPVAVSVLRTVHGVWLGAMLGLAGVWAARLREAAARRRAAARRPSGGSRPGPA